MKKEKSKYNIFSNIAYALRNIWKWDKAFYLFFIPSIPLAVFLPLAATYFPKILIDSVESKQSIQRVIAVIGIYFVGLLIINLLNGLCESRLQMRQYNISLRYQHKITEKHMRTDYANVDNPEAIMKYQHAMNDACSGRCAPEFIWQSLLSFLISLLGIFTYGFIIAIVSPWILAILFLSSLIAYWIGRWQTNYIEKNKNTWGNIDLKINYLQSFSQKFDYAKDIRIYGMFGWLSDMLTGFQKERFRWTKKVSARSLAGVCINALLTLVRNGAAYAVLIVMVFNNKIGAGDFVFYFGAITGFSAWLNGIGNKANDIMHKSIKIGYYRDYFEIEEKYNHGKGCALPTTQELPVDIEFNNVSFKYPSSDGEKYALRNINLKIRKGEKLAIVGANGAGKTTTMKMLTTLIMPTSGEAELLGHSIKTDRAAVKQIIGISPQESAAAMNLTARENLELMAEVYGFSKKVAKAKASELIERFSMREFENRKAKRLSGGEVRRLSIAMALISEPKILFLDEPTLGLDVIARHSLWVEIEKLKGKITVILTTHYLEEAVALCDRIGIMAHGKFVSEGTSDELVDLSGEKDFESAFVKLTNGGAL